jgi:hypothetical protein
MSTGKHYVGTPRKGQSKTYKCSYVAGVLTPALYDAPITKISFRNTTLGTEEVLTYGGSDPFDSQFTRISVGLFEWWFTFATAGLWTINTDWSETINGQTVTVEGNEMSIRIIPDPRAWVDVPAP